MKNILKYGVLVVTLLTPLSAYAGFGDPSPNAWGVGGVNDSASQSPAEAQLRLRGPGERAGSFSDTWGCRCAPTQEDTRAH